MFLLLVMRIGRVRETLASRYGVVKVAAVYGPFVWMVMSFAVIPVLLHRPPSVGFRWWVQFVGHFPFVGLPIVAMAASGIRGRRIERVSPGNTRRSCPIAGGV